MKFRVSKAAGSLKPQRPSRTASALQESEERLRIVARATNDAVWDWDLATDTVWWNEAVQTLFGYQAGEVGGDIAWWTERVHPEDSERIVSGIHAVIDAGEKVWSDTYRYRRRDGSYAYVYDRGYIIYQGAKPIR